MKVKLFFIMFIALLSIQVMAQDIPNGDFVTWENRSIPAAFGGGTYARPTDGWDCLNMWAPGSCEKVEGRTANSSAALLTTKQFTVDMGNGNQTLYTSVLVIGDFLAALTEGEPTYGIPFTGKPTKFSFWYKYKPVSGDIGRVLINLYQGDDEHPTARWRKKVKFTETVSEWTKVEIDLTQTDNDGAWLDFTPEKLCVEVTSSLTRMSRSVKDSELSNVTQEGSLFYITEMKFYYDATGIENVSSERATVQSPTFNLSGQPVTDGYKGTVIKDGKKLVNK